MTQRFGWGHINLNVGDLDESIAFYEKLGFTLFVPAIPYLDLQQATAKTLHEDSASALAIAAGTTGRACIMQLDDGFPKLDLTEFKVDGARTPLTNKDRGLVRICLISQDLQSDYVDLSSQGVAFLTPPQPCHDRLADVAVCKDPDGTLIELLQVYLERWPPIPGVSA